MTVLAKSFETLVRADQLSLRWVAETRSPVLDRIMRALTRAGDWQAWAGLAFAGLITGGSYRTLALQVVPRLLLTLGVCYAIKRFSKRPRPSEVLKEFSSLLKNPDPYSFPSSHTACAWVVCVSLGLILGWGWPVWILYASAISYSRIHVGAHYPLDVLMGMFFGVALAVI